jgi:hypothetical protein
VLAEDMEARLKPLKRRFLSETSGETNYVTAAVTSPPLLNKLDPER